MGQRRHTAKSDLEYFLCLEHRLARENEKKLRWDGCLAWLGWESRDRPYQWKTLHPWSSITHFRPSSPSSSPIRNLHNTYHLTESNPFIETYTTHHRARNNLRIRLSIFLVVDHFWKKYNLSLHRPSQLHGQYGESLFNLVKLVRSSRPSIDTEADLISSRPAGWMVL